MRLNKIYIIVVLFLSVSTMSLSAQEAFKQLDLRGLTFGVSPMSVPGTNSFLNGENSLNRKIDKSFAGALKLSFDFRHDSQYARLYNGVYQGIGADVRSFCANTLLGTPVSVYIFQGAPIARFSPRLWLGYEWEFGAAFGWKHGESTLTTENVAVSTSVTAHMGFAVTINYLVSRRWLLSGGVKGVHFSNGNTSWPNRGVNGWGADISMTYLFDSYTAPSSPTVDDAKEADRPRWIYDIIAYGGWRKRSVIVREEPVLIPGHFGVAGIEFSPMRKFNRWVAAGMSLDMQFDEGAGLTRYWAEGTMGDDIKFYRPPFGKRVSVGLSAHAELIMPIFAVNAGIGINAVNPRDDERLYQSLTLKAFVTQNVFLNVGYRLGAFKEPQNLMLGVGFRL